MLEYSTGWVSFGVWTVRWVDGVYNVMCGWFYGDSGEGGFA